MKLVNVSKRGVSTYTGAVGETHSELIITSKQKVQKNLHTNPTKTGVYNYLPIF
jgi:hypothetical protein